MQKARFEAFTDAVIAIIMTIMVLELHPPHDPSIASLRVVAPTFLSYLLSFVFLGIYWNNHHHMLHAARKVNGASLWANQFLLLWLSMVPFATAWMGQTNFAGGPVAIYGVVLFGSGAAYYVLAQCLVKANGKDSAIAVALGNDQKGIVSLVIYGIAIAVSFVAPVASGFLYATVSVIWLIPDRRFEKLPHQES